MEAADRSAVPDEGAVDHAATPEPSPEPEKPSEAEVAKAELNGKFEVEFKLDEADDSPLTLHFETVNPAMWWDFAELQNAAEGGNFGPCYRFLRDVLGREQIRQVHDKVATSDLSSPEGAGKMFELVEDITVASGLNLGKSQASSES